MAEKTEKATPKKLRDARKKGQVAKSQDLPAAFTFIASIAIVLGMSSYIYGYLGDFLVSSFKAINKGNIDVSIVQLFYQSIIVIFLATIPIVGIVTFIGVLVNFLAVGPVWAPEVFKFDIKRFNPVQNLKQKFKLKTWVELIKSCLKIGIAGYIIYDVMYSSLPVLMKTASMPILGALLVFHAFLLEVVIKVGLFFLVVAVLDFLYQRKDFAKEMKMEKFEVKQEYKNTEGDPQIKSKRRQIAQEIAYQEGPNQLVKRAQAVVVNPTHIAVAIGYDIDIDPAPYILTKAKDVLADRIIKAAQEYGVPVVRNIKLAHKLWDEGEINGFVPEDTYEALAEILRWIAALNTDSAYEYEASS